MARLFSLELESIREGLFVGANKVGQVLGVLDTLNIERVAQCEGCVPL
jgi:hypothetical protein